MKTRGVARIIIPELIVISDKLYKVTVLPLFYDPISKTSSIEEQIILREVTSEDEDLKPKP